MLYWLWAAILFGFFYYQTTVTNKQTNKMTAQGQYNIIKQEANNSSKYTKWPPRANTIYQTTMKN
jgi:hypothetical protein